MNKEPTVKNRILMKAQILIVRKKKKINAQQTTIDFSKFKGKMKGGYCILREF